MTNSSNPDETSVPFANEPDDGSSAFEFQFGAYGSTKVCVYADSLDDAFEIAVEWLDDHAPGHLVSVGRNELMVVASDNGLPYPHNGDFDTEVGRKIIELAEEGLTVIGHTTLKHGQYIVSDEWHAHEIEKP